MRTFWGETHTHTFCGGGKWRTIEEAVATAREHLDFWAPGEHHNHPLFDWDRICQTTAGANAPGQFVTLPGHEVGSVDGDFNAYYPEEVPADYTGKDLLAFFHEVRSSGGIAIPHHIGYKVGCRGMQWDRFFQPDIMPLVEIFSMHGSSECDPGPYPMDLAWMGPRESDGCAVSGLKRGLRFGFIASSDGHNGYPGTYGMGLVGVKASELTRESIFDALRTRQTWAITGDRIDVCSFSAGDGTLGSVVKSGDVDVSFEIEGLDTLDTVDVIKNGETVKRFSAWHKTDNEGPYVLRIGWGWGAANQRMEWNGQLMVKNGHFRRIVPIFGPPAPDTYSVESDKVEFASVTSGYNSNWTTNRHRCGNECGMVLVVDGDLRTQLDLSVNGVDITRSVGEMMEKSEINFMPSETARSPWDVPKLKIFKAVPACRFQMREEFKETLQPGDSLYLRVRQNNSQIAWLSPIFAEQ